MASVDLEQKLPQNPFESQPPAPQVYTPPSYPLNYDQMYSGSPFIVHQMPTFGPRVQWWTQVQVPEKNHGVMINSHFPGHQPCGIDGKPEVIHYYDEAIRNETWRYIGQRMARLNRAGEESIGDWLEHHADYQDAVDMKGELKLENRGNRGRQNLHDYRVHHAHRNPDGIMDTALKVDERLGRELLNERQMHEFFGNPDAVAYESL
eukprot:CAMPEP_0171100942 /NCGR_PEP_ID=MMETSP0766_2-20121228/53553_1 /TAXON_ID=439317 /ORGANISM="Gambierdiscus australes, Strain CAWD 149" /LENGTH=205 /DNA_ID=CAMNT_0011560865 /DNA_START=60 /DNA_END=677 /DNA_ORIENTATION=-